MCYKIVVQPMTWLNAAFYCRDMDAQLPKVDNESDNFFVKRKLYRFLSTDIDLQTFSQLYIVAYL